MKQIIALVSDGKVKYGLVDDHDGSLTEFAQVKVPEHFGLTDAALLGTNLVAALGLNGPKPKAPKHQTGFPKPTDLAAEVEAAVQTKRKGSGKNQASRGSKAKAGYTVGGRYVTEAEIVAVINAHPEGISIPEIAQAVQQPRDEYEWMRVSVNNRIVGMRARAKRGEAIPITESKRFSSKTGTTRPVLMPVAEQVQSPVAERVQGGLQSHEQQA